MEKNLKAAIAVQIVVLVTAFSFLVHSFARIGRPPTMQTVLLVMAGVFIAFLLMCVVWYLTLQREVLVRRFFLSRDWVYNHEIGYAPISMVVGEAGAYDFVAFAADALAMMAYGFDVAEAPNDFEPILVIDSVVFLFHLSGDEEGEEDDGVVVDEWRGVLRRVSRRPIGKHRYATIAEFDNAGELARLLDEEGAIATFEAEGGDA